MLINLLKTFFYSFVAMAILFLAVTKLHADEPDFKLLELDEARFEYVKYLYGRNPLLTLSGPKDGISFGFDSTLAKYGFFNGQVVGTTDQGQYREVELDLKLGVRVSKYVDLFFAHQSIHVLDMAYPYGTFPESDIVGITIYLYSKNNKNKVF